MHQETHILVVGPHGMVDVTVFGVAKSIVSLKANTVVGDN